MTGGGPDRLDAQVARLRMLDVTNPGAAVELAIELVERERVHRVLEPALALIERAAAPGARVVLRARFVDLAEHGDRHDQDCALRVGIVKALAAIGSRGDAEVAEAAIATIQIRMGVDVAQNLRAEGLLFLAAIEPDLADFRAVELLADAHTSTFSGEPAATAIRVLAGRGQLLPIWAVARRADTSPDVLAQAFASLAQSAPKPLQTQALLEQLAAARARGEEGEALALVAAEAILLNGLKDGYAAVLDLLRTTPNLNLSAYLEAAMRRSEAYPLLESR